MEETFEARNMELQALIEERTSTPRKRGSEAKGKGVLKKGLLYEAQC
jgi:hypothetical protein